MENTHNYPPKFIPHQITHGTSNYHPADNPVLRQYLATLPAFCMYKHLSTADNLLYNKNKIMVKNVTFSFVLILFLDSIFSSLALKNKDKPCKQFEFCKCIFPTGRGMNLKTLNTTLSVQPETSKTIYLHLCENVSLGNNLTSNFCFNNKGSVCIEEVNGNITIGMSLGKTENMKFISDSQFRPVSLLFDNVQNKTNIALICDEEASEPKLNFKNIVGSVYNLELRATEACVRVFASDEGPTGGLSTGSVLVIMLLVFILVYFGGGMLTLRMLRGAEGREMIPNVDFWTDLPYLVRDGVLFAMNGFRPPPTYDRI